MPVQIKKRLPETTRKETRPPLTPPRRPSSLRTIDWSFLFYELRVVKNCRCQPWQTKNLNALFLAWSHFPFYRNRAFDDESRWGFGWVDKAQCFRSARRFGAAGSSPDFSRGFSRHGAPRPSSWTFFRWKIPSKLHVCQKSLSRKKEQNVQCAGVN